MADDDLTEAERWAAWFAAERDWHAAGHHNYARLLREQVTYCREDCPNDNATELRQVQDLVRWLTANRDWLQDRITAAIMLTENEMLAAHSSDAPIECFAINYSLAPHVYFKPEDWERWLAGSEVNLSDSNVRSVHQMLWGSLVRDVTE